MKEINTFIHQGCIKLIKSDSKLIYKIFIFQINAVLLNCLFIQESWKKKTWFLTKILCSTTVFNIDNNQKCFLSSKSAYQNDFWRSCDTEDWSNDAENTAAHHRNKLQFNRYSHRKQLFEIVIIIQCFQSNTVLLSRSGCDVVAWVRCWWWCYLFRQWVLRPDARSSHQSTTIKSNTHYTALTFP